MEVKYIKDHKTQETVYPITKSECIVDAFSISNVEIDQLFDESPEYESSDSGMDYLNYNGLKHYHKKISEKVQTSLDNMQVDLTGYATDFEEATLVTSATLNYFNEQLSQKSQEIQTLQSQVTDLQNQISTLIGYYNELAIKI